MAIVKFNEEQGGFAGGADEIMILARGLAVLEFVANARAPVSNREIAVHTRIPKPTVSRITNTLVGQGYLHQLPDSERFAVTAGVLKLSNGFLRNLDIRGRARSHLEPLAEHLGATIHLGVCDRLDMVLIDTIRPSSAIMVARVDVGARLDLGRSAIGRAYLSALPAAQREPLIASLRMASGSDWPRVGASLDAALQSAARSGYALGIGDWHPLINAIAVPLTGPAGERYAVNCGGAAAQFAAAYLSDEVAPRLMACVAAIAAEIGGQAGAAANADGAAAEGRPI